MTLWWQCCSACTWPNVSSSNKMQRNYNRLKITGCMHSCGKLRTTRCKKTKKTPTAISEEPGAKAGYYACPLHTASPKGWADRLSHPSSPTTDIPLPSPHKRNQLFGKGAREHINSFCYFLQLQESQQSLAWISCLVSSQFLLIGKGQEPWPISADIRRILLNSPGTFGNGDIFGCCN